MRYRSYLLGRYRALLGYIGALMVTIGALFFVPLLTIFFYPEEFRYAVDLLVVGLPLVIIGFVMWKRLTPKEPISVNVAEAMMIVLIIWLIAAVAGAIPFMLNLKLSFTQAVFECVSGLTTTGLSIVDVTTAPRVILIYRSLLQFAGGAGFVIVAVTALAGPAGAGLSAAEGRTDQLAPHARRSAGIVLRIYFTYLVIGVLALKIVGMGWFDAVNHAMTALATGGFSTKVESIGYWDSAAIEAVIICLMILGATNFLTAYTLIKGKVNAFIHNGEIRLVTFLLIVAIPLVFIFTTTQIYGELQQQLRPAIFEPISALSGTGFGTVIHADWNAFGWMILVILMTIGGGSGSTAGGLKLIRVYVIIKAIRWEFRRAFLPEHAVNEPAIWQGEERGFLSDTLIRRVALYVFFYIAVLFIGTSALAAHGYDLGESLFEFASALGTVGLSVGITSPDAPPTALWSMTIGMFLGRLEFFAVFIGISKLLLDGRVLLGMKERQSKPFEESQAPQKSTKS